MDLFLNDLFIPSKNYYVVLQDIQSDFDIINIGDLLIKLPDVDLTKFLKRIQDNSHAELECSEENCDKVLTSLKYEIIEEYDVSLIDKIIIKTLSECVSVFFNNKDEKNLLAISYEGAIPNIFQKFFDDNSFEGVGSDNVMHLMFSLFVDIYVQILNAEILLSMIIDFKNNEKDFYERIHTFINYKDNIGCKILEGHKIPKAKSPIVLGFSLNDINALVGFEIANIMQRGLKIKTCKNCGKYFIPINRSDTEYCDRLSPQSERKTCKEYGAHQVWYRKQQLSQSSKLYRNIYSAMNMRVRRSPDIPEYKEVFERFKKEAVKWKKDVLDGIKSDTEYITWLEEVKKKKMKW